MNKSKMATRFLMMAFGVLTVAGPGMVLASIVTDGVPERLIGAVTCIALFALLARELIQQIEGRAAGECETRHARARETSERIIRCGNARTVEVAAAGGPVVYVALIDIYPDLVDEFSSERWRERIRAVTAEREEAFKN